MKKEILITSLIYAIIIYIMGNTVYGWNPAKIGWNNFIVITAVYLAFLYLIKEKKEK